MLITFVLNKIDKSFPLYKNNIFYSLPTYHIKKERISSIPLWKIFKKNVDNFSERQVRVRKMTIKSCKKRMEFVKNRKIYGTLLDKEARGSI